MCTCHQDRLHDVTYTALQYDCGLAVLPCKPAECWCLQQGRLKVVANTYNSK